MVLDPDAAIASGRAWKRFGWATLGWTALWVAPLMVLVSLALHSDLFSHVLLVPIVAGYLIWAERPGLPLPGPPAKLLAGLFLMAAAASATIGWFLPARPVPDLRLALWILAYVLGIVTAGSLFLGRAILRYCLFSFAFLLFLVPLPQGLVDASETGLQHGSAEVADWMFNAAGTPYLRDGQFFHLSGLSIEVAQECSGFRSTLVLLIVSVLAGKLFLRTTWKRILLIAVILPLGLARNGFRIFTLAELTVNVDPNIINSALHHRGGPLFFLLSLIPLNLLLWGLWRSERLLRDRKMELKSQPIPPETREPK